MTIILVILRSKNLKKNLNHNLKFLNQGQKFLLKKTNFMLQNFLYFASGIPVLNKNKNFIEFEKDKWIKKKTQKILII